MTMGRFLVPAFAFDAILLAWILDEIWNSSRLRRGLAIGGAAAVIILGLLPGWNVHAVPAAVRERFRFRFNRPEFDSEFDRWHFQAANSYYWSLRGRALREYVTQRGLANDDPTYTDGVIGALGYYSGLYIYDWNGLVTPEVAHREIDPSEGLRSPGHDKTVARTFFLKYKPTILAATVVQAPRARIIAAACRAKVEKLREEETAEPLEREYSVDVARIPASVAPGPPGYIITWTRIADGTAPQEAWRAFAGKLSRLEHDEHLPPPP